MTSVIQLPYKEKKTASQLIEVFKKNGVQFKHISEADAIPYLEERNYYYKFACYRKNFRRDKMNKYIDLDFQYLISLSRLDKELRYILLQMTLEIEHSLKVKILKDVSYNNAVDGYEIVHDYIFSYNERNPNKQMSIDSIIKRGIHSNSSNHGIYNKVIANQGYIAIWQLIEFMQMQELVYFFEYYFNRYPNINLDASAYKSLLISSRYIRNAAAHNTPLLVNLSSSPTDDKSRKGVNKYYISKLLIQHLNDARVSQVIIPTYRFKDIAGVLKLYKLIKFSTSPSEDSLVNSLKSLLINIHDNPPFSEKNNDLMFFFKNLQKLFDDIYK